VYFIHADPPCPNVLRFREEEASQINFQHKSLVHTTKWETIQHELHIKNCAPVSAEFRIKPQANFVDKDLMHTTFIPVGGRAMMLDEDEVADENRGSAFC
jgi:hypothetical protein